MAESTEMTFKDIHLGNAVLSFWDGYTLAAALETIRSHHCLQGGSIFAKVGTKEVLLPGNTLLRDISDELFYIEAKPVVKGTLKPLLLLYIMLIHTIMPYATSMPSYTNQSTIITVVVIYPSYPLPYTLHHTPHISGPVLIFLPLLLLCSYAFLAVC